MNKPSPELKDEELNDVSGGLGICSSKPDEEKPKCDHCGSTNVSVHAGENWFTCDDCGKKVTFYTIPAMFVV